MREGEGREGGCGGRGVTAIASLKDFLPAKLLCKKKKKMLFCKILILRKSDGNFWCISLRLNVVSGDRHYQNELF